MTYQEADSMQQAVCSNVASSSADASAFADAARYIDPNGAAAFTDCVKSEHGGMQISSNINDSETLAVIALAYQPPFGAGPATILNVSTDGWTCAKPDGGGKDLRDFVGQTGGFSNSQAAITCRRTVVDTPVAWMGQQVVAKDAQISVSTTAGSYTRFFRPIVFADPLADTAKVMASYPKGTILPYVGHADLIPAGWHVCDGHAGTVNLVNYIPYGAGTDAQVDAARQPDAPHEGQATHTHTVPDTDRPYVGFNVHVPHNDNGFTAMGNDTQHHIPPTGPASNLPLVTRVYFIQKIL
jgi:hypothetical protein